MNHGELLGRHLMDAGKGTFDSGTESWVAAGNNTIENDGGALKITYVDDANGAQVYFRDADDLTTDLTVGKTYQIRVRAKIGSGSANLYITGPNYNFGTVNTSVYTWYEGYFVATNTNVSRLLFLNLSAGEIVWIDEWSLEEIIVAEITEILNVGAPLGVIKERWGATLTNTAVTLFQDGDVNAMEFNGVNSLINCGTMDPLIGDKSFVLWLRGYEYSGPNTFFIGTTIFALAFDTPNDLLHITSDGGGTIANDAYVLPLNEYTFIAVTRTAEGLIDFYENGVLLYSGLDTGTPEAGTDIKLNLEPTSFRGLMADARIYDGLLSAPEISSLFTNESKKYLL